MRITVLVAILLLIISCSRDKHNFTIEVQVKNAGETMMYLQRRSISGTFLVDSAMPDKSGRYILQGFNKQPDFYIVFTQPKRYINLIIHPGDDFKVLTNAAEFDKNYIVEGSKDSRLIQKMVNVQIRTLEKITELTERYEGSVGEPGFEDVKREIDSSYDEVFNDHKNFTIQLIKENPSSLASLMALYQQLGRNTPVFDYRKDFRYYEMVDSNLASLYPNSEAIIDLNRKVTELRDLIRLEIGSQAPEINLPDISGRNISLSSLRGKNILLIFWASWSTQSVKELSEFNALYTQAALRNVDYYQVSFDRTKESWQKIISDKNLKGFHVSDLKYWDSPMVELYHIERLPVVILLNKEGRIVQKDITSGEFNKVLEEL